ncbi:NTE family protein RssA [Marinomonas spartinae]|uniref:NTE family protein RssA n=1 Tax=Marinomonas spartinae TaxID=1792290 RepID=A0A1A8TMH4_9GAMM|nr:patatin-like phospholipase family protein [Marinomonas spartinae]SBS34306.1 NTE family protein RssA [Marinomonas spartinae]SBS37560.1 NTE family protein RssA [Marinomonas spartinae]
MKKTVSLVLGSGAARGYAHIGVIKAIEDHGYKIISVSGCSIGSVIGGVYAAGRLSDFSEWASSLDKVRVLRMLDMSFRNGAYIKGDRFFKVIEEIIGRPTIESLPIPFTSVAVDLLNQKEFWFQKGDLIDAMRASSAIPSIVSPVELNGRVYVDGGVLNPLPIIPTVSAGADYLVAVDLNGPAQELTSESLVEQSNTPEWWLTFKGLFGRHKSDEEEQKASTANLARKNNAVSWGRIQTVNMMFETMQESLAQYKLAGYSPNLLISIPKDLSGFYEFWRATELIEFGYEVTVRALKELTSENPIHFSFPKGV